MEQTKRKEIRVGDRVYLKNSDMNNKGLLYFTVEKIEALNGTPFIYGKYGGFPETTVEVCQE